MPARWCLCGGRHEVSPLKQQWNVLNVLIANGGIPDKRNIAGALRHATPEIDDIVRLMHTPQVCAFLQVPPEGFDPVVEQFLEALNALLFRCTPIVPAGVQHYIADLIDPPKRDAHRPKQKLTGVRRVQLEFRKLDQAQQDVAEMKTLLARHGNDKAAAFAAFARAQGKGPKKRRGGITVAAAKRRIRQAVGIVEAHQAQLVEMLEGAAALSGCTVDDFLRKVAAGLNKVTPA